jgi:hypothetical protein
MKKLIYDLFVLSSLFIAFASCSNNDRSNSGPSGQTLEQRFPQWTNLTWISTDEYMGIYPRMDISIRGNTVTIRQDTSATGYISGEFSEIVILGNMITFVAEKPARRMTAYFAQTDSTMKIKTQGLLARDPYNVHIYLLSK